MEFSSRIGDEIRCKRLILEAENSFEDDLPGTIRKYKAIISGGDVQKDMAFRINLWLYHLLADVDLDDARLHLLAAHRAVRFRKDLWWVKGELQVVDRDYAERRKTHITITSSPPVAPLDTELPALSANMRETPPPPGNLAIDSQLTEVVSTDRTESPPSDWEEPPAKVVRVKKEEERDCGAGKQRH
jgi:hypothetical protein